MPNINISILAIEETMIYTLAGPYDIFSTAAVCSQQMRSESAIFVTDTSVVGIKKGHLTCYNGLTIECQKSLTEVTTTDLIIIPSVEFIDEPFLTKYPQLKDWLTQHYEKGAVIASICAGAFLIAETGLLDGKIATTHWAFADLLQEKFPEVEVYGDKIITEQDNVICAGGATSWQDLVTYLLEKYASTDTAKYIENFFLLNTHGYGQKPFKKLTSTLEHNDQIIMDSQQWVKDNLTVEDLLKQITQQSGLAERTFKRRFKKATKQSPNEYIQNERIDTAKYLLLSSKLSIQKIGEEVGLFDGSYFRRLFKAKTGMTANAYRKSFTSLDDSRKII
ncbi:MAG: helix-turn-helix domain-containing protein [Cycloclasticus sp.]